VSPELFRAKIQVLANLVEARAQLRSPEAQTVYQIRGSNTTMQVDFSIIADHGRDDILITYENGAVWFSMLY
jgi:hypothetical protein